MWGAVSSLLTDPATLQQDLQAMIEREGKAHGDPEAEARAWAEKLAEADGKRSRYQDMAAQGFITFDELRAKLADLGKVREAAGQELENLRRRKERLEELRQERDVLLESWAELVPASLETLSGLERNKVYRMVNLLISPSPERYEVSGSFCIMEPCGSS